jgi:teichoic acid transport system permease protein
VSQSPELKPVGQKLGLIDYIKDLWKRRFFMLSFARARVEGQNSNAALGHLWLLLTPMLTAAVYYLLFGVILGVSRGIENFIAFLVIGVMMFRFTSISANAGSLSIISNKGLIRSLHFPRALLPIAASLQPLLQFFPSLIVVFVAVIATGEPIRITWLLIIPIIFVQFIFNTGLAMLLARVVNKARDLAKLAPFLIRMWGYLSGIFFSIELSKERFPAPIEPFLQYNPAHIFMQLTRSIFIESIQATSQDWILGIVWALVIFILGFWFFFKGEGKYGRD